MKVKVGRHIAGITLNPLEYILDGPGGEILWFDSKEKAFEFLKAVGTADEDIYWYRFIDEAGREIAGPEMEGRITA